MTFLQRAGLGMLLLSISIMILTHLKIGEQVDDIGFAIYFAISFLGFFLLVANEYKFNKGE